MAVPAGLAARLGDLTLSERPQPGPQPGPPRQPTVRFQVEAQVLAPRSAGPPPLPPLPHQQARSASGAGGAWATDDKTWQQQDGWPDEDDFSFPATHAPRAPQAPQAAGSPGRAAPRKRSRSKETDV